MVVLVIAIAIYMLWVLAGSYIAIAIAFLYIAIVGASLNSYIAIPILYIAIGVVNMVNSYPAIEGALLNAAGSDGPEEDRRYAVVAGHVQPAS